MTLRTSVIARAAARGARAAFALLVAIATFAQSSASKADPMPALERIKGAEKGTLKNPLTPTPELIAEGKALYQQKTCGACHGPAGGGIHCPPISNGAWVYGSDDDTLFRLIAMGSEELGKAGYVRGDKEIIAGPMPGFAGTIDDDLKLWKIIVFLRSLSQTPDAP